MRVRWLTYTPVADNPHTYLQLQPIGTVQCRGFETHMSVVFFPVALRLVMLALWLLPIG